MRSAPPERPRRRLVITGLLSHFGVPALFAAAGAGVMHYFGTLDNRIEGLFLVILLQPVWVLATPLEWLGLAPGRAALLSAILCFGLIGWLVQAVWRHWRGG